MYLLGVFSFLQENILFSVYVSTLFTLEITDHQTFISIVSALSQILFAKLKSIISCEVLGFLEDKDVF